MRLIPLCLLGLLAASIAPGMISGAEAAPNRGEGRTVSAKSAKAGSVLRTAARPAAQPQRSAVRPAAAKGTQLLRRPAMQPQRTAVRPAARPPAGGARLTSWQAGLPLASGTQRECPVGTLATLARGHDDVIRCMPL
ncbi:hypothetical protein [Teichococcus aestuarii]|uniref:Uncharacterized protein n=1 Tax=Teichococcus aestuarii TaxID=568898 RepID=A0A2U1V760_9PROT|nr:hypothetical protein [Pseudoroseomonas aestuarii]PWC29732.1 hypothetical protein CR165_07330 [Pseudoroseomonas aestuarii]